jgi:histidinol dehydrogenase
VAALALGTESIPRVECIVGPGNAYVAEAKVQLARHVRTDVPAGPSELLVVADAAADPARIAAEIAAQAEHGDDSVIVVILVAIPEAALLNELATQIASQPRRETILRALERCGAVLTTSSLAEAISFADAYAPEHLLLAVRDSARLAERRCAGTVFLGERSSVTFGDYISGANHVLPTAGYARTHSGLSSDTFVRWTTIQEIGADAASQLAAHAAAIAVSEGLAAHAAAAIRAGAQA